jgi:regulator of sigma E protease
LENREELNPEPKRADPGVPPSMEIPPAATDGIQVPRTQPSPSRDGIQPASLFPATAPLEESDADDAEMQGPLTIRDWLVANSVALLLVAAVIGFVFYKFSLDGVVSIGKAVVGLSFVVFIHELGHFLVAKWCDVHVTTFSIGFGPAVPGCAFRMGETTYKFSLVPLGGYVQMVGQVDGDEGSDGSESDPRSYRNKSVFQRMAIISAGVIMNVILAVICFVVVFRGPGKERLAAVVGTVDSGSPAFVNGVRWGAEITQIGDVKDPTFEDLFVAVMGSTADEKIKLVSHLPGQPSQDLDIEPRLGKLKPMIGLGYSSQLTLALRRVAASGLTAPVEPGSAAAAANPPLQFGDRIVGTTDPDDPTHIKALPDDPTYRGKGRHDYFEFARRMKRLAAKPVEIEVERDVGDRTEKVVVAMPPMFGLSLGARMQMGQISAIRLGSAAYDNLVAKDPDGTREGDLIEGVEVTDVDGKALRFYLDDKTLDPERLPFQLKQWAQRVAETPAKAPKNWQVKLRVRRHRNGGGRQFESVNTEIPWDDSWRFDEVSPGDAAAPMAIPELGLAYQIKAIVGDPAAESDLQVGDVIKNVRFTFVNAKGEDEPAPWLSDELEEGQWARISFRLSHSPGKIKKVELKIVRATKPLEVSIEPKIDTTLPLDNRGWLLMPDQRIQRSDSIAGAIKLGLHDTRNSMLQVFQNLRGMVTGRLSIKNLGGPVLIANAAFKYAGYDIWEFVFFLGLISVNLAVVNFLPIPVLDGGHMVFLVYEKLRGRPASETVRVVATYAGLAVILSLFLVVTWNDIWRFFM